MTDAPVDLDDAFEKLHAELFTLKGYALLDAIIAELRAARAPVEAEVVTELEEAIALLDTIQSQSIAIDSPLDAATSVLLKLRTRFTADEYVSRAPRAAPPAELTAEVERLREQLAAACRALDDDEQACFPKTVAGLRAELGRVKEELAAEIRAHGAHHSRENAPPADEVAGLTEAERAFIEACRAADTKACPFLETLQGHRMLSENICRAWREVKRGE
jgi:uncharacterized membrane protein YccC